MHKKYCYYLLIRTKSHTLEPFRPVNQQARHLARAMAGGLQHKYSTVKSAHLFIRSVGKVHSVIEQKVGLAVV